MTGTRHTTSGVSENGPRRESVSHNSPDVVLIGIYIVFYMCVYFEAILIRIYNIRSYSTQLE